MITVAIVDDHPVVRTGLRTILAAAADIEVVAEGASGIEGTSQLKALALALRVILVSAYRDRAALFTAAGTAVGAEAFLSKDNLDLDSVRSWK